MQHSHVQTHTHVIRITLCRIPTIELLSKDSTSEKNISKSTESSKSEPDVHEYSASAPSVELHVPDTKSDKGEVDSDVKQSSSEAREKTSDCISLIITPQLDSNTSSNNKPDVSLIDPSNVSSDITPQPAVGHPMKANTKVVSDGAKVSVGPKHYGAPMQKLPPRERVMSALLQWKTSETVRFLAGCLPDYSKTDGDDEVSKSYMPITMNM